MVLLLKPMMDSLTAILFSPLPIDVMLGVIVFWIALGVLGLFAPLDLRFVGHVLFPLGAVGGLVLAGAGLAGMGERPETATLALGLPGLPFHLRLDALSAFFLVLLGAASAGISIYSAGYFRKGEGAAPGVYGLQYHFFLAAMALVMLADDAYLFMVAWETMALSSYFLVTSNHKLPEIRRAGFLYLLIAHLGAIGILLSFGVMQGGHGDYTFAAMRASHLSEFWASVTFLLALFGFGAKAGILPLHVWLPEAHPAAPSPVSALMSGVMLKTAIYGLLRVTFDLLPAQLLWWGVVALLLGLLTALFGVMFAAVQTDMKRLLAYSSIENIGIILVGIGLTLIFRAYALGALAAIALAATLYHCLNHAFFKSLLFLVTGTVLHSTRERSLGKLGGLIRSMPWVAWLALIGTLAIAGLPPLNGFVSEWLLLQAFLATPSLPSSYLSMLVPVEAAAVVLAIALAGYVMVKFYGVIFLGQPREEKLATAHDANWLERLGLGWLALGCVVLGLAPVFVLMQLDQVTRLLTGYTVGATAAQSGWLFVVATSPEHASYSPLLFLLGILTLLLLTFVLVRKFYHGRMRRGPAWDCGYPQQTARMQDTAEGFGQPIKQIFEPFFRIERQMPGPFDAHPRYQGKAEDKLWYALYLPIARLVERLSLMISTLQHGRIHIYLLYSFVTLLVLLLFTR
ncbi:hydrogenase 4 subunit B [Sulfuriferula plumbiphila]|uniref:Hydrogenase 4 subunit B n=1 Tax=Sulfuriferula plumbiphila TaxID=171865 RepID=A0A512LBE2_9PROT|nr:hydrogenase 4 subunit B [Sulfuriferula plumbiphila]BBP06055.1 hydrogenase 4 subunit B [Sulfuriferula plumbiphila]GEP31803.1 hydrogenase 4 subunit B [Sulfuriferula plumbiphila]